MYCIFPRHVDISSSLISLSLRINDFFCWQITRVDFNFIKFNGKFQKTKTKNTLSALARPLSFVNCPSQGYYRVHYDEENWKLLAQTLEKNHETFPAETRASLVDDVLGLASVGLAKYATAFDFIKYMQMKERHYAPWGVLMRHLLRLNGLLYETSSFSVFQVVSMFTKKRNKWRSVLNEQKLNKIRSKTSYRKCRDKTVYCMKPRKITQEVYISIFFNTFHISKYNLYKFLNTLVNVF